MTVLGNDGSRKAAANCCQQSIRCLGLKLQDCGLELESQLEIESLGNSLVFSPYRIFTNNSTAFYKLKIRMCRLLVNSTSIKRSV